MHSVHSGPLAGLALQAVLLSVLAVTAGLGLLGWAVGLTCGAVTAAFLMRGLRRAGTAGLGPADWVTLVRACLIGGVTALVAESFVRPIPLTSLVALSTVALILDGVDGQVARRTNTASQLGALFDQECDAFLILVLSIFVAGIVGWWVVTLGVARYAYLAASWAVPWLRIPLPPRYWRKVVAAVQGVVLTVIAAGVLPWALSEFLAVGALVLLAESFGRDIWWQWSRRGTLSGAGSSVIPVSVAPCPCD